MPYQHAACINHYHQQRRTRSSDKIPNTIEDIVLNNSCIYKLIIQKNNELHFWDHLFFSWDIIELRVSVHQCGKELIFMNSLQTDFMVDAGVYLGKNHSCYSYVV